ncbi:MAG: hypothetical protein ACO2PN_06950 [Pyrobaculum sp.]
MPISTIPFVYTTPLMMITDSPILVPLLTSSGEEKPGGSRRGRDSSTRRRRRLAKMTPAAGLKYLYRTYRTSPAQASGVLWALAVGVAFRHVF